MSYYLVMPAVVALIKNEKDKVLLGRHSNDEEKAYPGRWDLIAGKLGPDEQPSKCCEREVFEETGFSVVSKFLYGVYHHSESKFESGFISNRIPAIAICYEVTVSGDLNPAELEDMHWVGIEELQTLKSNLTPWTRYFLRDMIHD